MVSMTSPWTPNALPMNGVISALPVNHRMGGSLKNLILKISSHVNDRRCLWGKFLSSMIRYRLNVTNVSLVISTHSDYMYKQKPMCTKKPLLWDV